MRGAEGGPERHSVELEERVMREVTHRYALVTDTHRGRNFEVAVFCGGGVPNTRRNRRRQRLGNNSPHERGPSRHRRVKARTTNDGNIELTVEFAVVDSGGSGVLSLVSCRCNQPITWTIRPPAIGRWHLRTYTWRASLRNPRASGGAIRHPFDCSKGKQPRPISLLSTVPGSLHLDQRSLLRRRQLAPGHWLDGSHVQGNIEASSDWPTLPSRFSKVEGIPAATQVESSLLHVRGARDEPA
jgi:hypothetical protein